MRANGHRYDFVKDAMSIAIRVVYHSHLQYTLQVLRRTAHVDGRFMYYCCVHEAVFS